MACDHDLVGRPRLGVRPPFMRALEHGGIVSHQMAGRERYGAEENRQVDPPRPITNGPAGTSNRSPIMTALVNYGGNRIPCASRYISSVAADWSAVAEFRRE